MNKSLLQEFILTLLIKVNLYNKYNSNLYDLINFYILYLIIFDNFI